MTYSDFETVEQCDLCQGTAFEVVDEAASVVDCRRCGHRFVSPRPTQAEIGAAYSSGSAYASWIADAAGREALWARRWRRVSSFTAAPGRLLDVGAGLGTFAALAARDGWAVEATEVSSTAVAYALEHHDLAMRLGQLEDLDLVPGFDLITLWHVIEHVPSPTTTLRRLRELVTADGLLVLALPNDGQASRALSLPGEMLRAARGRSVPRYEALRPGGESHVSHFTPSTIRRALSEGGFAITFEGVDDAQPTRSRMGNGLFRVRTTLTRLSPWNFGREMLVVARPVGTGSAAEVDRFS